MRRFVLAILVLSFVGSWTRGSDERFLGAWLTTIYHVQGQDHAMDGIMIFTPSYYSANVMLNFTGGPVADANANSGPYWAEDGNIIFGQWMQLHFRPGQPEETFLKSGVDEPSTYRFENADRLVLQFPSGNFYVLERLPDSSHISGLDGLWSYRTLASGGGKPVQLDGLFLLHQGSFLQQCINRGSPEEQLGQGHLGSFREGHDGIELTATTGIIVDPSSTTPVSSRNNSEHKIGTQRMGNSLTFTFGTGTVQVFDRIQLAGPTEIHWLEGGGLGLVDKHFILVVDGGDRKLSASGTFTRDGNSLTLQGDRWIRIENGAPTYLSGRQFKASIEDDGVAVDGWKFAFQR